MKNIYSDLPLLGKGKFSYVYHYKDSIIKLINKKDAATIKFIHYIQENHVPHNHFPVYKHIDNTDDYYVYMGEKYKPITYIDSILGVTHNYFIKCLKFYPTYGVRRPWIPSSVYDDLDIILTWIDQNKNIAYLDISKKNIMLNNDKLILNDLIATRV